MGGNRQKLIIVCGPPCSGKSSLSLELASALDVPMVEMDQLRMQLFPGGENSASERHAAYAQMHSLAVDRLSVGGSIVLNATYQPPQQRESAEQISKTTKSDLFVIQCFVTPEVAVKRFLERLNSGVPHAAADLTEDRVAHLARTFQYARSVDDHKACPLVVDTTTTPISHAVLLGIHYVDGRPLESGDWARSIA